MLLTQLLLVFEKSKVIMRSKIILSLLFFIFSLPVFCQQTVEGTLIHDGLQRDYRLYVPSSYAAGTPIPLVFNLHGYTSNASQQQLYSEMDAVAETNNFLVCYPNGEGASWNVGWAFGSTEDDVGFISNLIDELAANYSVNLSRVYSCGMSNGGFMSYRLACELNDKIAAIASVTGSHAPGFVCEPGRPVPVLEIHGTADGVVAYNGTAGVSIAVEDVIDFWVNNNNCGLDADTIAIANTSVADLCTATRYDYNECENSKVSLIKIQGGGHTWPGASLIIGVTNQDINASEEIWEFFSQFNLDGIVANKDEPDILNDIKIFPNPVHDILNLNADNLNMGGRYYIMNNISQKISGGKINGHSKSIPVGHLQPGIYYLTIVMNDKYSGQVFIKK